MQKDLFPLDNEPNDDDFDKMLQEFIDKEFNSDDADDFWQAALERSLGFCVTWVMFFLNPERGEARFHYLTFWEGPAVITDTE